MQQLNPREQYYRDMHLASGPGAVQLPQDMRNYVFGSKDPDNKYCGFEWDVSSFPAVKSLYEFNSDRQDQYSWGACVGNGWAKACEIMFRQKALALEISRMFIYYNARKRVYDPVTDSGCNIQIAVAEMTNQGVALETLAPYANVNDRPPQPAYDEALSRMVNRYEMVGLTSWSWATNTWTVRDLVRDVKVAINCGMPVVFGTSLTSNFYGVTGSLSTHKSQYNPLVFVTPNTPGYIGGHCMVIVGYDDVNGWFLVENSWGNGWGDNGLIAISYESMIANSFELFCIREMNGWRWEIPDSLYNFYPKQREVSWDIEGVAGQVYRLYQASFNRRPDWDGLGYQIYYATHGLTLAQVANNFTQSPEYQSKYGNLDNAAFVRQCYLLALYREPEPGAVDYHVARLVAGVTRGELMIGFSESPENKANTAFYLTDGIQYYPYTPSMAAKAWNAAGTAIAKAAKAVKNMLPAATT